MKLLMQKLPKLSAWHDAFGNISKKNTFNNMLFNSLILDCIEY